jgi:hypothetical protein
MVPTVSQGGSSMAENIRSTEYQQFLDLKEQVQKGMEDAETEFMAPVYFAHTEIQRSASPCSG